MAVVTLALFNAMFPTVDRSPSSDERAAKTVAIASAKSGLQRSGAARSGARPGRAA